MPTNPYPLITQRFDMRDGNGDILTRWDLHIIKGREDDWVEVYNVEYEEQVNSFKAKKELIVAASIDEVVEFFEKILGFLKTQR